MAFTPPRFPPPALARLCSALLLPLLAAAPAPASPQDLQQAKVYLREHLKALGKQYPFEDWRDELDKTRKRLDKLRPKCASPDAGADRGLYRQLEDARKELDGLAPTEARCQALMGELPAKTLSLRLAAYFYRDGKKLDDDTRFALQQTLQPFEEGSLRPKRQYLQDLSAARRDCEALETDWIFGFSSRYLGARVQDLVRGSTLAGNESQFDDLALQADYWSKAAETDPALALAQLQALRDKLAAEKPKALAGLRELLDALSPDMLFSDLLAYAQREKVEITVAVEDKIEASLKAQSGRQTDPIRARMEAWAKLERDLPGRVAAARTLADKRRKEAVAEGKAREQENERLEALRAEQRRQEKEHHDRFQNLLSGLTAVSLKVELDPEARKALASKALLRSSYVRSGQTRLPVDKRKFSDTLAFTQKFSLETGSVDFSKMTLDQKASRSAFVYKSPAGRTSMGDLEEFVNTVAMGAYGAEGHFLSYLAPPHWRPGKAMAWAADRDAAQAAKDREFSYVDLVIESHRKVIGGGAPPQGQAVEQVNLPANMLVILHPQGQVLRYQQFADIRKVVIQPSDLVDGKLYYKFLNFSADRENIYLNGIDPELKVSQPAPPG